jgi:hypothetical protein
MSFKKPFRAVPIQPGRHYQEVEQQRARRERNRQVVSAISGAFAIGILGAIVSVGLERPFVSAWRTATEGKAERELRERSVYYSGCNAVRAARAAPIYAGEPGYRSEMDGDSDGTACEPYHP